VVWLFGCPWISGNCLGMLVMLRYMCVYIYIYIYIYIYAGLPCMCDIILEWGDG